MPENKGLQPPVDKDQSPVGSIVMADPAILGSSNLGGGMNDYC